ncbi:cysteine proteinase [Morchella conica CCBAS932]|uniref:Cysteine proteinase n=2 Tax=Morchella sect. Distantes TaxID=1051054 RepID=A0A3N4KLH6_9PEZI|nr:cysteine proteinase [Morchella conica CCBAS932]
MITTSLFPQPVHSLPSPAPSVACTSTVCSITNIDDLALARVPIPTGGHPETLSPPESLTAAEDAREDLTGDELPAENPKLAMDFINEPVESDETLVMEIKPKRRLPKKTYSKKDNKGKRRSSEVIEDDSYDSKSDASSYIPPAKRIKVVGLKNLGNTCYNNAVIQALSHTKPLRDYFLERKTQIPDKENTEGGGRKEDAAIQVQMHMARPRTRRAAQLEEQYTVPSDVNLCDEFSRLLKLMWNDEPSSEPIVPPKPRRISKSALVVSPHAFATAVAAVLPLFQERYEQHDAQEFLRCALERMQNELITEKVGKADELNPQEQLNPYRIEDNIVQIVFGGILWNKIICLSCEDYTIKPDPFLDLSLVIPELSYIQATSKSAEPQNSVTLEDCLDLFSSAEELEGSPSPPGSAASSTNGTGRSCLSCGSDTGFSKAFKFGALPRILCIHLKRFRWRRNTVRGSKQKVDAHVRFPLEGLDMGRWMDSTDQVERLYDLYAVVVHQGSGASSGHYYAYVKYQDEWWSINDDRAHKVTPEIVAKAKAYLLFYQQKEVRGSVEESPGPEASAAAEVVSVS